MPGPHFKVNNKQELWH